MCSTSIATDTYELAVLENKTTDAWIKGNAVCLNADLYPATIASVINTQLDTNDKQQCYWTGIIRANTLLRRDSIDHAYHSDVSYGFLDGHNGKLNFTSNGMKPALCSSEGPIDDTTTAGSYTKIRGATKSIEDRTIMRDVTKSTECQVIDDTKGTTVRSRSRSHMFF
ncbi:hypothetical protein DPMN_077095 [Dreissena polymorpha]|uniref:Uncharacterized protein n=1 Tax=Dreissena polymorpha TaxID=45954 RepID=A0A9D4BP12_DREPO|nr:hypothetical protein DPMN_077095 [Dreissena polymorpha]